MHIDITTLIYYLLAFAIALLLVWLIRLEIRMSRLLRGKGAKTLEDSFKSILDDTKQLHKFTDEMEKYLTTVESRLNKSIQAVETTRFNPFKGTGSGGNQSFSSAFIDEKGNGVVLTSMYSRDRISMFAKPLNEFASEFELSEEELESINKCKEKLTIR